MDREGGYAILTIMKKNLVFIAGILIWTFIAVTAITNKYDNTHKAYAANVNQTLVKLQIQLHTYQKALDSAKDHVTSSDVTTIKVCKILTDIHTELIKYKVNIAVPLPKECR